MAEYQRITAQHVGRDTNGRPDKRPCRRCGVERFTNSRTDWSKPFICGDCKRVDPLFGSGRIV